MKLFFTFLVILLSTQLHAQVPKNGVYTYDWCDIEYNKCLGKCKIKIRGNKVWIYAPANLSGIKEGELYETGTISKHASGRWIIVNADTKNNTDDPLHWIDFKAKKFWTF